MWNTSCLDWEDRILSGRSMVPDLPLFEDQAAKAIRIFRRLKVPDIAGTPTLADACGEWFFPIVEAMCGSYDPVARVRMIQEFFLLVAKGNAKTSYGGALMLVALIMNERPEAEFHLIAPTMSIANYALKQASGTIKLDPEVSKIFQIQTHLRTITHRSTGATLQIKAADTDVITGGKQVGTMIDETHEFGKKHNAASVFVEIRGALGKRPDGFLFQTTTQSKEPPSGVFKQELDNARAVRDGVLKLPVLPILYELPQKIVQAGEWRNEKYWSLINPNMGRSVRAQFLTDELMKADREGPAKLALIASQHFNVEIGLGLQTDRWAGADFWLAAAEPDLTLEALLDRCDTVTIGVDGGGLDDLLGLCVLGRETGTRRWLHWAHAWCHPKVLELRKEIAPKLLDLQNCDDLTIVKSVGQDVIEVVDIIKRIEDAGLLPGKGAIGVDPVGITDVIDELELRGFDTTQDGGRVIGIPQGWTLSNTIKTTERRLAAGDMVHCGQLLMAYCVGNAKVEPRGNAITITKQTAGTAKIDPLMATFNAVALMTRNPENAEIYSDGRELRFA